MEFVTHDQLDINLMGTIPSGLLRHLYDWYGGTIINIINNMEPSEQNVMITSLWRQNDVVTSFWRDDDVNIT